jgi:hypothetical protein
LPKPRHCQFSAGGRVEVLVRRGTAPGMDLSICPSHYRND